MPKKTLTRFLLATAALLCTCSGFAQQTEETKLAVVDQLYKITDGVQGHCKASPEASPDVDKAVEEFRAAYPELMELVDHSPYLPTAKVHFNAAMKEFSKREGHDELVMTCRAVANMLRQFIETTAMKEQVAKFVQALRQ